MWSSGTVRRTLIVAEFEGELAATDELFVLPAVHVGIGGKAREEVGDFVEVIAVFRENIRSRCAKSAGLMPSWMG